MSKRNYVRLGAIASQVENAVMFHMLLYNDILQFGDNSTTDIILESALMRYERSVDYSYRVIEELRDGLVDCLVAEYPCGTIYPNSIIMTDLVEFISEAIYDISAYTVAQQVNICTSGARTTIMRKQGKFYIAKRITRLQVVRVIED